MKDERKTKAQLVQELEALRKRCAGSETKQPHVKSSTYPASFPEMNPNPVLEADFEGTVHYLNPGAKERFPDLQTLGVRHPWLADWHSIGPLFKKAGKVSHRREIRVGDVWYEQAMYFMAESGRIRIYGFDITDRKRMEEELGRAKNELEIRIQERTAELAKASKLLERAFSAIDISLAYMDKDFNFIRVNRAYAEADERIPEFYIGKNHFALFPHEENEAIFKKVVETGEPYLTYAKPFTYPEHPERGITYWDWSLQPVKDPDGSVGGVVLSLINVTESKRAEKAVVAERQRFLDVLEMLPAYLVLLAPDYHVPFANRFFRERFGESHGRRCFEYLFGRSEACEICETYSVMKTRAPHEWEWTGPDGHKYDVFDFPFTDTDGSTLILEMGIDITERKRAEQALEDVSLYARGLIEANLDPLVMISADGQIMDVNKATELVTGVARQDLIGSDFSDYFTEPEKAREGYKQVFLKGSIRDYPLAIRHTSGRITEVLYNATVFKNEAGEVQGVFAAARDITKRKSAEQERLRLATAIEQTAEGISILDTDRRILYVNSAFEKLHDLTRQEVLGRKYDEILSLEIRGKGFQSKMPEILSRGEAWHGHSIQGKPGGGSLELEITVSPVRDASGAPTHYVAMERDMTLEMKLQDHVRQWQKMEALGTLAGGIAHDFNNILMPIVINTELALLDIQEGKSPSPHYLQLVQEAANRGQELVKQIITFSRQKEQLRRPEEITPVIKEGLKFIRATIPKSIEIRERVNAQSALILADSTQIHQVLMNLCSNAAHAMRGKGGILEVSLTPVQVDADMMAQNMDLSPGPYIRLTVSDTGHGMDREVRERAFDPFFTTKKPGEGTGMGLAVVHGIVKNHEGFITLYSEVGKGTTVHVFLPRVQGEVEPKVASSGPIPTGKERILLVDDEEIQVRSVQNMLERLGYRVIGKTDSRQALEVFRAQPDAFDLVITDQTMPHLTGEKLAEELLAIRPDLPIILCTGFSEAMHEEVAKAAGIRDFAMKPLTVRDMAGRIRRALKE